MNAASAINGAVFFRSFMAKVAKMDSAVGPQDRRQLAPSPGFKVAPFRFCAWSFSRFLCSRCALSRARQEGAVFYGRADPPEAWTGHPRSRAISVGRKYLGPKNPAGPKQKGPGEDGRGASGLQWAANTT